MSDRFDEEARELVTQRACADALYCYDAKLCPNCEAQTKFIAAKLRELHQQWQDEVRKLNPREEWHEDFGSVLWWRVPIVEPPYCGSPLEDDFPEDYYTHWSKLPEVKP